MLPPLISHLDYIEIPVTDLRRSVFFYSSLLKVGLAADHHSEIGHFATFPPAATGLTTVLIEVAALPTPRVGGAQIYFALADALEAAAERAEAAGGRRLAAPVQVARLGRIQFVLDPDGHRIGLREPA